MPESLPLNIRLCKRSLLSAMLGSMTPALVPLLMCPQTRAPLRLVEAEMEPTGLITSGWLVSTEDRKVRYPVINGIPRFVSATPRNAVALQSVSSFGDEWNFFNFHRFRENFENQTIANTFGPMTTFVGRTVVDAGAGSGMQARWLATAGAAHVIALELSHAVDGAVAENLKGLINVDLIQCSIDAIPLRDGIIPHNVLCMGALQHTASVPHTLTELWRITGKGGELAFDVYLRDDTTRFSRGSYKIYRAVREVVASMPFSFRLAYASAMSGLRFVPLLGWLLEKADLMRLGEVPAFFKGKERLKQRYRQGVVNTFTHFNAHAWQHHLTFAEIQGMVASLKPQAALLNPEKFFTRHPLPGTLLRLRKT